MRLFLFLRTGCVAATLATISVAFAGDPGCPRYPAAERTEWMDALELDRAYTNFQRLQRNAGSASALRAATAKTHLVDKYIFAKLANDNVPAAPATTDAEFVRRIYLDLTGRIPTPEQAESFLSNTRPTKRAELIEQLLATPAFTDQLTTFWANKFKVTRSHESISVPARNTFYNWVRRSMEQDRPYDQFVRELLSSAGELDSVPGTQFFGRWMDVNGPIQDSWDDITDKISTTFLGYKTECISCHNGRGHLEKINLFLTRRTRLQFWRQSAFLSRMFFVRWSDDNIGFRPRIILNDRNYGSYTGAVSAGNPGNRPARVNAVVEPEYLTTGERPQNGNWRQEYARILTRDRQFARATVNHIWALLFGSGIVDPPEAWDFERTDPRRPPPGDWPLQISHPELLEELADFFIQNNYQFRPLFRLLTTSEAYQLSSRYEGTWQPHYVRYFAKHEPQRLTAEQLYDSMVTATRTEQPITVVGLGRMVQYANQLPDPTEPSTDFRVIDFLNQMGRGNWLTIDRSSEPTLLGLLYNMNDSQNVYRTGGTSNATVQSRNRVIQIDSLPIADEEAVRRMFLATLSRPPSEDEVATVMQRKSGVRAQWLSDLQWALLNKLDFIFNY